ncbi:methyltransferase domain-containing protein [Sphingomonas sp. Leaf38]|uniref:methyltransferase domain-containing protein n=1 Tax=Sphingomonas sp. Leaf38 TaxID=1736217 RepID=UPI000A840565|nr:methyltransferase domain-containing protein [Sphingomonas sp. Leaf38]
MDAVLTSMCNICGNENFSPAPGNRLSRSGMMPLCTKCRSLERHRIVRAIAGKLRVREEFAKYKMLSWGEQCGVPKPWFQSAESANIDDPDAELPSREDESLGFVIAGNVLQRLPDHRQAVKNLVRVLDGNGLILLYYPNPIMRETTEEWGKADSDRGQAYRMIGRDFEKQYGQIVPDAIALSIEEVDPVTRSHERIYLLTKSPDWMRRSFHIFPDARILD